LLAAVLYSLPYGIGDIPCPAGRNSLADHSCNVGGTVLLQIEQRTSIGRRKSFLGMRELPSQFQILLLENGDGRVA
jgi:hypothetical protein